MYLKVTYVIVLSYLCLAFGYEIERHEDTVEVPVGNTIILHCKSNDDNHNFMFWHLTTGEVIGPRNDFDDNKFKFEVLSGNLTIKGITENDAGTYSCISDGVDKRDISVHSVNLLVKNGWKIISNEESINYEQNNKNGNLWKVSAILGCIILFLVIILFGIHFYHKETDRPKYCDIIENEEEEDEEDSTEELFTREPSTSGIKKVVDRSEPTDNFEKVYSTINMSSM